eukprot:CAMPEP_0204201108 /NCGR_PEP_ID=MMETSP0361-20130328/67223_1 /ASSEMBLY_ACC=CAM_ASM_000343 /TAXON_ID=268821 /ORGANISM="Scrippsiella Hangoei, Strain SHTV-5" /LENGTH=31 /DNA_ID= /DNA_START= /DNA_END= /DNA_ORIENTATION=
MTQAPVDQSSPRGASAFVCTGLDGSGTGISW